MISDVDDDVCPYCKQRRAVRKVAGQPTSPGEDPPTWRTCTDPNCKAGFEKFFP